MWGTIESMRKQLVRAAVSALKRPFNAFCRTLLSRTVLLENV